MSGSAHLSSSRRAAKRRKMSASGSVAMDEPFAFTPTASRPSSSQSDPTSFGFEERNDTPPEAVPVSVPVINSPQHLSSSGQNGQDRVGATWPAQLIPVEIFNLIIEHLDRRDIKAMRLVNHEFDSKIADRFFRHVVVPFRPEFEALYGTLNINSGVVVDKHNFGLLFKKKPENKFTPEDGHNDPGEARPGLREDESLLSDGYRVFEQFGPSHIKKFALALELDEKDLASPPVKLNQQIIPAPWGLYRWPIMDYQRFSQLEGLEKMADETQHMKKAFQFLSRAVEIGISCDAGLGYLQGPDTNHLCRRLQPSVFQPATYDSAEPENPLRSEEDKDRSLSLVVLKKMAMNAGYDSTEWPRAVLRLLEDEGRAVEWVEHISPSGKIVHERVPLVKVTDDTAKEDIIQFIEDLVSHDDAEHPIEAAHPRDFGLNPIILTPAQAEMLLELEWAHRALMESFVIAVMDNKSSFLSLRKLTIARCPARHVPSLMDEKFWETMTCIEFFHLGVIPDWRRVNKDDKGVISQRRVSPVDSYGPVFQLLHEYVGEQKSIQHVSFEWICGGEFAVGRSQRDRYILPAPLLLDASHMVHVDHKFSKDDVLELPFVRKLSLKNCWVSPHVFLNIFKNMSMRMLEYLELESVSLTGPPSWAATPNIQPSVQGARKPLHWPWPLCAGAEPGNWFQLRRAIAPNNNNNNPVANPAGGQPAAAVPTLPQGGPPQPVNPWQGGQWVLFQQPWLLGQHGTGGVAINHPVAPVQQHGQNTTKDRWRLFSWPHVLASLDMSPQAVQNHLENAGVDDKHYPNVKLAERHFSANFRGSLEDRDGRGRLREIRLKSCGYALVDCLHIDNWEIIPDEPLHVRHDNNLMARLKELDCQMLTSDDPMLGKILNYIPDSEQRLLRTVFGLDFGWAGLYDDIVRQVAIVDGNPAPGEGRFHGIVSSLTEAERQGTVSKGKQVRGTGV